MNPERILIVRLSAIGDVIHALPCLNALRTAFPDAYIAWVVENIAADILYNHPQIDDVFIIPKKRWRKFKPGIWLNELMPFIRMLRSKQFDVAFDFQGLTKSSIISRAADARVRVGFGGEDGREFSKLVNNTKIVPPASAIHVVERNFSLLSALGITGDIPEPVIPIDPDAVVYIKEFLDRKNPDNKPLISIQPGAGWTTKQLPLETYAELTNLIREHLDYQVIYTWGPGEEAMIQALATMAHKRGAAPLVAPPTTLRQLVALVKACSMIVGGDTGPVHLASALGIPVVAIYGSSDAKRNAPYTTKLRLFQRTELPCVPCWKTKCPLDGDDHLRCLRSIIPGELFNGIRALLHA